MKQINFDDYSYYPALRTRNAELRALAELDDELRQRIVPLLTLGKWPKSEDIGKSADKAMEATKDYPYFIDLSSDQKHHTNSSLELLSPAADFGKWIEFVNRYDNAIPVVQISGGNRRQITQQARKLENVKGKIAFRVRDFVKDTTLVISALSALDDIENAIVFVDAKYIGGALNTYVTACTATINALRAEIPETIIALMSTSFPSSRTKYCTESRERGVIPNLDRELHDNIGGRSVAIYGDHGSIHSVVYDDQTIMRWSPTIDYALEDSWVFERRQDSASNEEGYIDAARALLKRYPEIETSGAWGAKMISEAASGNPFSAGPANWIAVRVNLHLTRQIEYASLTDTSDDFDALGEEDLF